MWMTSEDRTDGPAGERVLSAEHEWKLVVRDHAFHKVGELSQRRLNAGLDDRLPQCCHTPRSIGLAAKFFVVELELLAGPENGGGSLCGAAAIANRRLEAEGNDDGPRRARIVGVDADRIEKALLGRQILTARAHAWTGCASWRISLRSRRSCSVSAGYMVSIGSSSRIASSKAP